MSAPYLLIDGYNLLHAAGLARMQYGPGDLERARHRLLALLAEKLRADERSRCTVVFDAQQAPQDLLPSQPHHGISVRYAPAGQDADTAIENLIAKHPAARRLIVVSGDHRLKQAAKRRNATPMDSDSFLQELERRESISPHQESPSTAPPSSPRRITSGRGSSEEWQKIFGEIDIVAISHAVNQENLTPTTGANTEAARLDSLQRQLNDPESLERWLNEGN